MNRAALLLVPLLLVPAGCRRSQERTPESCLKEAIFTVQQTTEAVSTADDFESISKLEAALHEQAGRLRQLRAELEMLPAPSSWERSRMRKHRPWAESTSASWAAVEADFRQRIEAGQVPPHLRPQVIDAVDDFAGARNEMWQAITSRWEN